MTDDYPSRALDKIVIRSPDGLRDRIRLAAEQNNRSMNAEIVATLEAIYPAANPVRELLQQAESVVRLRMDGKMPIQLWRTLPAYLRRIVVQLELYGTNPPGAGDPPPRHKRAWEEGRAAFREGKSVGDNPYDADEAKYDVWLEGLSYEKTYQDTELDHP